MLSTSDENKDRAHYAEGVANLAIEQRDRAEKHLLAAKQQLTKIRDAAFGGFLTPELCAEIVTSALDSIDSYVEEEITSRHRCLTCCDTGKESRHQICRDCDET